ncbi:hypothetical protein [Fischerella sp. PCC 9605]|uniref:hypothetical protein n=1 Tax=Fischerella sp. PCC 9605 TaxID=1173024 RepID=UPI00047EC59E|nr:hypothetical protein [Fischerella sp. PCC 9605]
METAKKDALKQKLESLDVTDFPRQLSKTKFAKMLGVTRKTLMEYHDIVNVVIPEFKQQYPIINDEVDTHYHLNQYQQWVLWKVIKTAMDTPRCYLRKQLITDPRQKADLSYRAFSRELNQSRRTVYAS